MFIILKNIAYQKSLFSKSHKDDGRKKSSRYKERATGDLLLYYFGFQHVFVSEDQWVGR